MYHRCGRRPAMSFWTSHLDLNDDRQRSKVQGLLRQSSEVDALFVACLVAPVQIRPQRRRSEKEIWRGDSDTAYREMMRRLTWRGDDWWTSREMQFALRPFHFHFLTSFRSNSGMFALHQWNIISVPVCRRWRRSSDWKWKKPIKLRQSPGWTCTRRRIDMALISSSFFFDILPLDPFGLNSERKTIYNISPCFLPVQPIVLLPVYFSFIPGPLG